MGNPFRGGRVTKKHNMGELKMQFRSRFLSLAGASIVALTSANVSAQDNTSSNTQDAQAPSQPRAAAQRRAAEEGPVIVVTGTSIQGAQVDDVLPVTIVGEDLIDAIDPASGLLGIKAFAAAVIGGFGSLPGALAGGLIIGIVEPMAQYFAPPGYSQIMPYAIMLIVLVVRPTGLFAQIQQKKV